MVGFQNTDGDDTVTLTNEDIEDRPRRGWMRSRSVITLAVSVCVVTLLAVVTITVYVSSTNITLNQTKPVKTNSTTDTEDCHPPPPTQHGEWNCDRDNNSVTCILECDLGYTAYNRTVTTCTNNIWTTTPQHMSCYVSVALITGGRPNYRTVEIYSSDGSCNKQLPDLPDDRYQHTVDYVDGQLLLCGGDRTSHTRTSCLQMNESTFSWSYHSTLNHGRNTHSSVITGGQLTILGGHYSRLTTEFIIPRNRNKWTT